jgi:TonB family protein
MTNEPNDIERYLNNQMTDAERHALEKKALTDPFLADALEGAGNLSPQQFKDDLVSLNKNLLSSRRSTYYIVARIAAGLVFLVTAGWLIWLSQTLPEGALAVKAPDSSSVKAADTVNQMLTLAKPAPQPSTFPAEAQPATQSSERKREPAVTAGPASTPPATIADTKPVAEDKDPEPRTTEPETEIAVTEKATQGEAFRNVAESAVEEKASTARTAEPAAFDLKEEVNDRAAKDDEGLAPGQSAQKKNKEGERSQVVIHGPTDPVALQEQTGFAAPTGGVEAYRQYLEKFQQIPERARSASVHGRVTVGFTVSANGTLEDFIVLKSVGFGCEEELIRLIREGPAWKPAYNKQKIMPSTISVSLDF